MFPRKHLIETAAITIALVMLQRKGSSTMTHFDGTSTGVG